MSKYTGVFLGAGALLAVAGRPAWRRWLATPHPYLAGLLALGLFSPVVVWNAQHDWASFRFQFLDRFGEQPVSLRMVGIFVGFQLLVLTPVAAAALVMWLRRQGWQWRRWLTARVWLAVCFSVPLLLVMAQKSLRHEIRLNWTLPAYLSLLPALAQLGVAWQRRRRTGPATGWTRAVTATAAACLVSAGMAFLLWGQPRWPVIAAFGPWRELAAVVEEYEERLEDETGREPLILCAGKYRLASVLAFYRTPLEAKVPASHYTTSQWLTKGKGLGYEYWSTRDQ